MGRAHTPGAVVVRRGSVPIRAGLALTALLAGVRAHAKDVLPEPTYENTFYLFVTDGYRGSAEGETPYDEGWPIGPLPYGLQLAKLREMISRIGPDGPYLRLGVADALWPTMTVDPEDDWAYIGMAGLGQTAPFETDDVHVPKGPDPYFNQVIIASWAQMGLPGMIFMNSGNLVPQSWVIVNDTVAIPANLTAFLEQHSSMVQWYDDDRVSIADDADGVYEPRDYVEFEGWNGNAELGTMLGFSRLRPDSLVGLWERNMRDAMAHVIAINCTYPDLIVAVSIEPENDMNHVRCLQDDCARHADFSPLALAEWRQWLSHTGIYGPGGRFGGQGADPWYPTVFDFNAATGSRFTSWDEVDPRSPLAGPGVWDMYVDGGDGDGDWSDAVPPGTGHVQGWCERMVEHRCEDSVDLLWEVASTAGWTTSRIFTHQVPGGFVDTALDPQDVPYWGYGHRLCTLGACAVVHGRPGITGFRENTVNTRLFGELRALSPDGAWANLEFNPLMHRYCEGFSTDYDLWSTAYRLNWESGAHILCAFRWWVPPEASTWWANIRPDFHRPPYPNGDQSIEWESRLAATHDFVSDDAIRFRPWAPGARLSDPLDYLPPPPRVGKLRYESHSDVVSFDIDPQIFPNSPRLLWYDEQAHPQWPGRHNVFGWPEFSSGRFFVYRDTIPSFRPGPMNLWKVLSVPSFAVVDSSPPNASAVFYAVVAVDNGGDRSGPARIWVAPQILCPDSLSLTVEQESVRDTALVVANRGLKPLRILSIEPSVSWLEVRSFPSTIPAGDTGRVEVRCTALGLAAGAYAGTLAISSNDPFEPTATIGVRMGIIPLSAEPAPSVRILEVFPQPASTEVIFLVEPRLETAIVELVDVAGRVVQQTGVEPGGGRIRVPLGSDLADGVYVARLRVGERVARCRVVVIR